MSRLVFVASLIASFSAFGWQYKLEVFYPDKEKKQFVLDSEEFKINLKTKKWSCFVTKVMSTEVGLETRAVRCLGPSKTAATSLVACRKNHPDTETLFIEEGSKAYQMTLSCKE